jgi:UDP-N-acetylmuramyl pentapeptide phosphotransferase/UDP-N-acetylglucosamine-1-phosphate transferase
LALLAATGLGLAVLAMWAMPPGVERRLSVRNHRGRPVPATLGIAVFVASVLAQLVAGAVDAAGGTEPGAGAWALAGGAALVFVAGLADDLRPGGPRGLLAHARELLRFHLTTGLLKAAGGVAGGVLVVLAVPGRPAWTMVAGVVLIAGAANAWNGLDVVPGRSGKLFVLAAVPMLFFGPPGLLARMLGAEAAALWPDLRERGMLGDAGSNLLGFALGAAAYMELADALVAATAAVVIALNVAAETITLSRVVDAIPPLRWLDRAGRLADREPATPGGSDPAPIRPR